MFKKIVSPISASNGKLISINSITGEGLLRNNSDFTWITLKENTPIAITGTLDVEDRSFSLPLTDDMTTHKVCKMFNVDVVNGTFTMELTLPSGQYHYDNVMANLDLPYQMFSTPHIKIDVVV